MSNAPKYRVSVPGFRTRTVSGLHAVDCALGRILCSADTGTVATVTDPLGRTSTAVALSWGWRYTSNPPALVY